MIPFIRNVQNRQIHRDRKQMNSCHGLGGGRMGQDSFKRKGISFWGDENVLKLDSSDGCTALRMH